MTDNKFIVSELEITEIQGNTLALLYVNFKGRVLPIVGFVSSSDPNFVEYSSKRPKELQTTHTPIAYTTSIQEFFTDSLKILYFLNAEEPLTDSSFFSVAEFICRDHIQTAGRLIDNDMYAYIELILFAKNTILTQIKNTPLDDITSGILWVQLKNHIVKHFADFIFVHAYDMVKFGLEKPPLVKLNELYQNSITGFKFHSEFRHDGHKRIIDFFKRNRLGTNNPIMTYLSILAPNDRCVVLEELYNPDILDSVLSDKLLLAYISSGKKNLAKKIVENSIRIGESDDNVSGLKSKLDLGLAPNRNRAQRIEIYKNFLNQSPSPLEVEFLNILISFCNTHYS